MFSAVPLFFFCSDFNPLLTLVLNFPWYRIFDNATDCLFLNCSASKTWRLEGLGHHPRGSPVISKLVWHTSHQFAKFGLNMTTCSKVMVKKFTFSWEKVKFLGIYFKALVRLYPNFEYGNIYRIDDLFAEAVVKKQVIHLGEKRSTWARIFCILKPLLIVKAFYFTSFFFYLELLHQLSRLFQNFQMGL